MNPSQHYEWGTLVEGFDSPATFLMTYNPPYYPKLLEGCGLHKAQDFYAYWGQVDMLPKVAERLSPVSDRIIEHYNIKMRSMDRSRFVEDVMLFLRLYNRAMETSWSHVPISDAEVRHMARELRHLIVPELGLAAEIDDQPVGVVWAVPDYNPRIKRIDGRLFPFGFIRLLWRKHAITKIRLVSTNVIPEFHRLGVGLVLLGGLVPKALEWGIQEAEFSWVLESNALSRGSLEKGGAKRIKTYRIYDWDP
jgi:GNAT superfamily N-acetyltransferase